MEADIDCEYLTVFRLHLLFYCCSLRSNDGALFHSPRSSEACIKKRSNIWAKGPCRRFTWSDMPFNQLITGSDIRDGGFNYFQRGNILFL